MNFRPFLILPLSLTLLSNPSWADLKVQGSDAPATLESPQVTSDSSIILEAELANPKPGDKAQIYVARTDSKAKATRNNFVYSGPLTTKIYLPAGPGDYRVQLYACNDNAPVCTWGPNSLIFVRNTDPVDHSYLLPSSEVQSEAPEILKLSAQITQGLNSDREKSAAIHDWVSSHVAYDLKDYQAGTDQLSPQDALSVIHQTTTPLLSECDGYAYITAALLRAAGIRAKVVDGSFDTDKAPNEDSPENHMWDEAWVDGKWITIDTTADAGSVSISRSTHKMKFIQKLSRDYFDPNAEFFAKTHIKLDDRGE